MMRRIAMTMEHFNALQDTVFDHWRGKNTPRSVLLSACVWGGCDFGVRHFEASTMGKEKVFFVSRVVRIVTQLSPEVSRNVVFVSFLPPKMTRKNDAEHCFDAQSASPQKRDGSHIGLKHSELFFIHPVFWKIHFFIFSFFGVAAPSWYIYLDNI